MKKPEKLKYSTNSIVLVVIIVGFLSVINYLGNKLFFHWDLTEGKEFTISKSTKNILKELDDIIRVDIYFSQKLPHHLLDLKTKVEDMLKEYQVYAKGKLKVAYKDPSANPEQEQKMRSLGIPQVQAAIIEKDQRQVVNIFLGIGVFFEDKKEVIPVVQNTITLEYDLTSAIKKVSSSEVKKVGFLTGHGEHSFNDNFKSVGKALQKQYEIRPVELKNGAKIPGDIATIVSAGSDSLSARDLFEIDQFIMGGGKAIFLVDEVEIAEGLQGKKITSNLNTILEVYGAKVNQDLVLDAMHEYAGFSSGFMTFQLPYPLWPKVTRQNLAQSNYITNKLESISLPWVSSIKSTLVPNDTTVTFTILAQTTEKGWTQSGNFNLNPQQRWNPTSQQQLALAVILSGQFKSAYAGKGIPHVEGRDPISGEVTFVSNPEDATRTVTAQSPKTSILIIGDSDFVTDRNLSQFGSNLLLFQNAVDYLTLDASLIAIRSRGKTDRPLKEGLSETTKNVIRFMNIFGVSIIVALFGTTRFLMRRKIKKVIDTSA